MPSPKLRLHLVSLPHTRVEQAFCGCAYTAKVLKFCKMMGGLYDVTVYAPEGPEIPGAELVPCLTNDQRINLFGADDPNRLPAWPTTEQTMLFNAAVIGHLSERVEPRDIILITGGQTHRAIADAFPHHIVAEPGVGYEGICAKHCAFESYAWMHTVYAKRGINDGRYFDCVIPNYFDVEDFPQVNEGRGDYLLFLGRLISRKGPHIASEIAKASGMRLVVAGAGGEQVGNDIVAGEVTIKDATYVGPVGVEARARLLAGARALIVPTTYIEPFGGVAVEAMMAGTPVIASDFGAFTETVQNGVSGYRFHTLAEGVEAVTAVSNLDPSVIRNYAIDNYSLGAVSQQFDSWFSRLNSLWGKGWYEVSQQQVASTPLVV